MFLLLIMLAAHTSAAQQTPPASASPSARAAAGYVPERVYETRRKAFGDFETMLADLARADVVLVGEQHDDPNTHRLESAILEGLHRRSVALTVSLEMFERDVQAVLDDFLTGTVSEDQFLKASRPWPRYATDYQPIVEMARARGWRVIASNVPRRHASAVAKGGLTAIDSLSAPERAQVARDLQCPLDSYFERFAETMNSHPAPGSEKLSAEERAATTERYYFAQCVKDETMAEAIAGAFERQQGRPGTIVHYNGAFHSDFGTGVAERVRRRLPGRRVAIVSILPVGDIDTVAPKGDDLERAEYLVYTVR
jgi:uncharacterized iron-regulated protein